MLWFLTSLLLVYHSYIYPALEAKPEELRCPPQQAAKRVFVAATVWRKPADWFIRRLGPSLINVLGVLNAQSEHEWKVVIFLWDTKEARTAVAANPIVRRLEQKGSVVFARVPPSHTKVSESGIRATEWFWDRIAEATSDGTHALIFDANTAFCGTANRGIDAFLEYDLVFPHGTPGQPMLLSTRAGRVLVSEGLTRRRRKDPAALVATSGSFTAFASKELDEVRFRRAPADVQRLFGVLETAPTSEEEKHPFAITALMRTLGRKVRTDVLHNCPEAKQMFPVSHDKDCIYQLVTSGPAYLCADKNEGDMVVVKRRISFDLSSTLEDRPG